MTREEAINEIKSWAIPSEKGREVLETLIPELVENEDERIRRELIEFIQWSVDRRFMREDFYQAKRPSEWIAYLEKQEKQKTIAMEVYEVGKGTTICGQDYRCKKDYKEGNCWYIKNVIYHCSRDGYLNDQNGVSWSCTPEWFKEYIQSNTEWAEEEKNRFVSGQFLQCKLSFDGFKEGEHYWLEYIGDDMYVGRSDNILNQKFHITPRQLYTLFSEKLEEVQGSPQEEKQVSLNYEPPFDENPSDKEIIEALIHHLNEQDGFLTAINCVSTKAILSWLKKQKEQKPAEWSEEDEDAIRGAIGILLDDNNPNFVFPEHSKLSVGEIVKRLKSLPERFNLEPKPEWSEEDEKMLRTIISDGSRGVELDSKQISWLKSLRPDSYKNCNSRWKPSEEQMEALEDAFRKDGSDEYRKTINSLYQDLKKLM